jgi:hypothetical protein
LGKNKADQRFAEAEIVGVGETGLTPAEQYEARERKQSLFQLSNDPFDQLAGRHRQSVSGIASGASDAATRRRSSAVAPDTHAAMASHSGYAHHSDKLAPIESRPEVPPVNFGENTFGETSSGETSTTLHKEASAPSGPAAGTPAATNGTGSGGHTVFHDAVTTGHDHDHHHLDDPDSVAPHEVR